MSGCCLIFRLLFLLENMMIIQYPYHLLHPMGQINFCLIQSWICIYLFKKNLILFQVLRCCQILMVEWMHLNYSKKRFCSVRVLDFFFPSNELIYLLSLSVVVISLTLFAFSL